MTDNIYETFCIWFQDNEVSVTVRVGLNNLQGGGERIELETVRGSESTRENILTLVAPIHSLDKGSQLQSFKINSWKATYQLFPNVE